MLDDTLMVRGTRRVSVRRQSAISETLGGTRFSLGLQKTSPLLIEERTSDVTVRRTANLAGEEPMLADTGQTMTQMAAERGAPRWYAPLITCKPSYLFPQ
jgi:hypothetical protein